MIWRKAAFALFLISLLQTGRAQILKGTLMTGGSLGFQYTTDHEYNVNTGTFNFQPVFGAFVAKNFLLGVSPVVIYTASSGGFSYNDTISGKVQTVGVAIRYHTASLGIGPLLRYYIKITPKTYVFLQGSPSIMETWYDADATNSSNPIQRTISAQWDFGPGLSVMLTKSVAVELSLFYQGTYQRSSQFVNGNLLGNPGKPYVDNGMVFNVGFQVYLKKKKKDGPAPNIEK